jgi:CBS domain-containing protein
VIRPMGLITPQELAWRAGLRLPLALLDRLTPAERDAILAPLLGRDAQAIMNIEPRSVSASTSLPQALVTMVEWGYTQVAIVDRQGVLLGLLGEDDVLRAAVEQPGTDDGAAVRDAEPPVTVALVMQRVLAQGGAGQRLAQALPQLLAAPEQDLLVLDDEGRLAGALTAAAALDALPAEGRAAFLAAIQRQQMSMGGAPAGDLTLAQLLDPATPTIGAGATLREAARRLLELGVERLAVVAADRSLLGIIARGGLVRALMQQSD